MVKTLFCFGYGYSAKAFVNTLDKREWRIIASVRSLATLSVLEQSGIIPVVWEQDNCAPFIAQADYILVSIPPINGQDIVINRYWQSFIDNAQHLKWIGYLSTVGVYGDHNGGWVDESTPLSPGTERGKQRVAVEQQWLSLADQYGLPIHILRLAGIYGPGRGPFDKVQSGKAKRVIKPNQVFNRIHVADIAQVLMASCTHSETAASTAAIYNVCDDMPAPPQDVIAYAAHMLSMPLPPIEHFNDADLSPMARSFYSESKRVRNDRIKNQLGVKLLYPNYKIGLQSLLL